MPLARGAFARRRSQSGGVQQDPSWIGTPAPSFTQGSAGTHSVRPLITNFDANKHALTLSAGSLLSGVTLDAADGYVYNGSGAAGSASGLQLTIANKADLDWIARSTAAGVTYACDFSGPNDFVSANTNGGHVFAGGMDPTTLARVVKDLSDGLSNGCCLRIDSPKEVGANSAAWMFPLNSAWTDNSQSFGANEFYIQFRFKIPQSRLALSDCGGNQRGWKFFNLAQYSPTNTVAQSFSNSLAEHVLQDTDQRGLPQAYHRTSGGSFPPFEGFAGGQITFQDIDRGAGYSGGDRYCHYPNGTPGCEYFPTNEWVTFKLRVKIASYGGSTGNEFDAWMLRKDAAVPVQIFAARNYAVGSADSNGGGFTGLNGGHFLTYETNRISNSPLNFVDTWHKYDQVIVSTSDIAWPAVGC